MELLEAELPEVRARQDEASAVAPGPLDPAGELDGGPRRCPADGGGHGGGGGRGDRGRPAGRIFLGGGGAGERDPLAVVVVVAIYRQGVVAEGDAVGSGGTERRRRSGEKNHLVGM